MYIIMLVSILFSVLLMPFLAWHLAGWVYTIRLYGRLDTRAIWDIIYITALGRKWHEIFALPLFIAWAVIYATAPGAYPFLSFVSLEAALMLLSRMCLPPSVLILGASEVRSPITFMVKIAFAPLRMVHLLGRAEHVSLRMFKTANWWNAVNRVADKVAYIIIDTRVITPYVLKELNLVLQPHFVEKTLFVVCADGSSPSLDTVTSRMVMQGLTVVRTNELERALQALRSHPRRVPVKVIGEPMAGAKS
jgi:hypothetical protein